LPASTLREQQERLVVAATSCHVDYHSITQMHS